ncbi:MAG: hypothetical protein VKL60_16275 [Sphaerospermopsis sp.]|nr:hypothetical protein [Sphaerospermopsis sp.]
MSTMFGIKIPETGEIVEIAFRSGIGNGKVKIDWLSPLAILLPDSTKVEALDNTAQGVKTLRDLRLLWLTGSLEQPVEEKMYTVEEVRQIVLLIVKDISYGDTYLLEHYDGDFRDAKKWLEKYIN